MDTNYDEIVSFEFFVKLNDPDDYDAGFKAVKNIFLKIPWAGKLEFLESDRDQKNLKFRYLLAEAETIEDAWMQVIAVFLYFKTISNNFESLNLGAKILKDGRRIVNARAAGKIRFKFQARLTVETAEGVIKDLEYEYDKCFNPMIDRITDLVKKKDSETLISLIDKLDFLNYVLSKDDPQIDPINLKILSTLKLVEFAQKCLSACIEGNKNSQLIDALKSLERIQKEMRGIRNLLAHPYPEVPLKEETKKAARMILGTDDKSIDLRKEDELAAVLKRIDALLNNFSNTIKMALKDEQFFDKFLNERFF